MNSSDTAISLRQIQHYAYCPHRWGLIHIGCDWSENAFVNRATLLHARADSKTSSMLRGKYIEHAVQVYHDGLELYGVLDCLQLTPDENGCYLEKYGKRFRLTVVEYKPKLPKRSEASLADRLQLLAQKLCTDFVFRTDCEACMYYADVRRRVPVVFCEEDMRTLERIIGDIRRCTSEAFIPPVQKSQYCSGCSMKDICLPKAGKTYA